MWESSSVLRLTQQDLAGRLSGFIPLGLSHCWIGSYKVVVSLTRTVLWQLSLGIFDRAYAHATAGSSEERESVAPDVFTAETPLGTYQGLDEQAYLSKSPGSYRIVIVPRGSNKPEWLS